MEQPSDLTELSATFPDPLPIVISREAYVDWLYESFSSEAKCLVVQGSDGSGKTTLLAQFAEKYSDRCFTYFIKNDSWVQEPQNFLREICEQMQVVVKGKSENLGLLPFDQLRNVFSALYFAVAKRGKREHRPYYFIIDGLEWIAGELHQATILSCLPRDPLRGTYVLASSYPKQSLDFAHQAVKIPLFTRSDTEDYLRQINITDKQQTADIYRISNGMPGYLDQLRREVESGMTVATILQNPPKGFLDFLEREWKRLEPRSDVQYQLLAIIAFTKSPLTRPMLSDIIGISLQAIGDLLESESFLNAGSSDSPVAFVSDAHKVFISKQLIGFRNDCEGRLIEFFEKDRYSKASLFNLPLLYEERYDSLSHLIDDEYIRRAFSAQHDLYLLRRGINKVIEAAHINSDWQAVSSYMLVSSVLQTIGLRSVERIEIDALLSVGQEQESLELANSAILLEDRLDLLITNAKVLKERQSPVAENLIATIVDIVQQITETDVLKKRILEIAADLFYVHPQSAIDLVEKVVGGIHGGRALDYVLAFLALQMEQADASSIDSLRLKIKDKSLSDFVHANSTTMRDTPASQVLEEVHSLSDTSARLLLLRSWCNANRHSAEAMQVIREALEIITSSGDYPVAMRHLRQFAEPLIACDIHDLEATIARFDLLKETALRSPMQEVVRLELLLATAEAKMSADKAHERLYYLYYEDVEAITDLDVLCYCMGRILLSLPQIDPEDKLGLRDELERELPLRFSELLMTSANQFEIAKSFLRIISRYDYRLAAQFAEKLNNQERKDSGLAEILEVYGQLKPTAVDMQFVQDVLKRISSQEVRAKAIVRLSGEYAKGQDSTLFSQLEFLLPEIENLSDSTAKCYAYGHLMKLAGIESQQNRVQELLSRILIEWKKVDRLWEKIQLGFDLVTVISEVSRENAAEFLLSVREEKRSSPLADSVVAELYVNTLTLTIRTFIDLAKGSDYANAMSQLIDNIEFVPSAVIRCLLFGDLALRLHLINRETDFKNVVEKHLLVQLNFIQSSEDVKTFAEAINYAAGCLYQYDSNLFDDLLSQIESGARESAAVRAIEYVISLRSPFDPIDFEDGNFDLAYVRALAVCRLLNYTETDSVLYHDVDLLVGKLVQPDPYHVDREKCVLYEKQALKIAQDLVALITAKLPQKAGIQHKGYEISTLASVARLREAAGNRAGKNWSILAPSWEELAAEARAIPNLADRTLVSAIVGEQVNKYNQTLSLKLIGDAQQTAYSIPNVTDRINRLQGIADVWKSVRDENSAKFLLREAVEIARASDWDRGHDKVMSKILETLHSIDPELAASLTSTLDSPVLKHEFEAHIEAVNLQRQTDKLPAEVDPESLTEASAKKLESLCSNKGGTMPDSAVEHWLHSAIDASFRQLHAIEALAIENSLQITKQIKEPSLRRVFDWQLGCLRIIQVIGAELLGDIGNMAIVTSFTAQLPEGLRLFRMGSRQEAIDFLRKWLSDNSSTYLKIYDPYFAPSDIWVLTAVPISVQVSILTTWKAQKHSVGSNDVLLSFREAWSHESALAPPETVIYVIGDEKNGESPIHDRYYITDAQRGLSIGTSGSGLGGKDSHIREMDYDEVAAVEQQTVDRMLINPPSLYKGNKLIRKVFQLCS